MRSNQTDDTIDAVGARLYIVKLQSKGLGEAKVSQTNTHPLDSLVDDKLTT